MLFSFDPRAGLKALILGVTTLASLPAAAASLSLPEAQALALAGDAGRTVLAEEASALRELAVAAGELPDPVARVGAVNVPLGPLSLDREDMTMIEFGLHQALPRARSRELERERVAHHALGQEAALLARQRDVALAVSRSWHELDYLEHSLAVLDEEQRWVELLVAGEGAGFAAGSGSQAALLVARRLRLELEEQRYARLAEQASQRARLARWIGAAAGQPRLPGPVAGPVAPARAVLEAGLAQHPRLLGLEHESGAAGLGVELARQRYKPNFGLDLSYGLRQGPPGASAGRPDMVSAMLTFDLPLFTRDRQDRELSAARARSRGAEAKQQDLERELAQQLQSALAESGRLAGTLALYEGEVLRLAEATVEAELASYRAGNGAMASVAAAQRERLALRLKVARLRADLALAAAEIEYLTGVSP